MSQDLVVTVRAVDGASAVFRTIGSAAQGMGATIAQAGTTGSAGIAKLGTAAGATSGSLDKMGSASAKASGDLGKLESASGKVDSTFGKLSKTGAAVGASIGALAGFLSDAARAAAEEEATFARLTAAVEATGKAYEEYAKQIDDAIAAGERLAFADDQTADALARLTSITGDAGKALELLGTAQDLARGKAISLSAASEIVGKVAEGNTGILGRYGIVVSDTATAQEALAAVQSRFAGQAEAYGATTQGALDRVANALDNFVESIGQSTGPAQMMIGLLPGIQSGFTLVSAAVGAAAPALGKAATALKGVAIAAGPVGIAIAAVTAAIGFIVKSHMDAAEAAKEQEQVYQELLVVLQQISDATARAALSDAFIDTNSLAAIDEAGEGLNELEEAYDNLRALEPDVLAQKMATALGEQVDALSAATAMTDKYELSVTEATAANQDMIGIAKAAGDALGEAAEDVQSLVNAHKEGALSGDDLVASLDALRRALEYQGPGWESVRASALSTVDAWQEGKISGDILASTLSYLADNALAYGEAALQSADAAAAASHSTAEWRDVAQHQGPVMGAVATATDIATDAIERQAAEMERVTKLTAEYAEKLGIAADANLNLARAFGDVQSADFAKNLNNAQTALDSVIGLFEQIDAIGQSAAQADSIATALLGDEGTWMNLIDLVDQGRISTEQYGAALEAVTSIQADNYEIQADLNEIRAEQIPLLAEQQHRLASYVDTLAGASAEEQQHALYLMDSANAAKVAAAESLAYSAAIGEIPKEVATDLIVSAAQADPILADILESYGLIEMGADGEITVNFPEGDATTLLDVRDAIDNLNNTFVEIGIALTGDESLANLKADVDSLDDTTVTVDVEFRAAQEATNAGAMGGLLGGGEAVTIDVAVDQNDLQKAQSAISDVAGAEYSATLDANSEPMRAQIGDATDSGSDFANTTFTATLSATIVPFELDAVKNARAIGEAFAATTFTATLAGDDGPFRSTVADATDAGSDFANTTFMTELDANTDPFWNKVNEIDGQTVGTVWIDVKYNDPGPPGGGGGGKLHGGAIPVANPQRIPQAMHGRAVWVGENGPELLLNAPPASYVVPSPASRSMAGRPSDGASMHFNAPVTFVVPDGDVAAAIHSQMMTQQRAG